MIFLAAHSSVPAKYNYYQINANSYEQAIDFCNQKLTYVRAIGLEDMDKLSPFCRHWITQGKCVGRFDATNHIFQNENYDCDEIEMDSNPPINRDNTTYFTTRTTLVGVNSPSGFYEQIVDNNGRVISDSRTLK